MPAPTTTAPSPAPGTDELPCHGKIENGRVEFYSICTNDAVLKYREFRIERAYLKQDRTSTVTIKKGKRVLARHSEGKDRFGHDSAFFGLFPLLGAKEKQLIVAQFTGGVHCCYRYWIYELRPRFRLIFDGTKYEIGDGFDPLAFQRLDRDGPYEFTQKIITFDYFLETYTGTPQPTMIFSYDRRRHEYLPANTRFPSLALKKAREGIKKLKELGNAKESDKDWPAIEYYSLDVLLSYIYAGKEKEAWRICAKFAGDDKRCPWRREIKQRLKTDSLYRFITRIN